MGVFVEFIDFLKEVPSVLPLLITAFIAELLVEELELIYTFFVCIDHSCKTSARTSKLQKVLINENLWDSSHLIKHPL